MTDILVTTMRTECLYELDDIAQNNYSDTELGIYFNDAVRFVKDMIHNMSEYALIPEEQGKVSLAYGNFSGKYKHNLPVNFDRHLYVNRDGYAKPIRITLIDFIDETTTQDRGTIYGTRIGAPVPDSGNSDTADDFDTQEKESGYVTTSDDTITITIASGTTFNWTSTNNGSGSGTTITGSWQELGSTGIMVQFDNTSGYTAGDIWTFAVYATQIINVLELNWAPAENIVVYYSKRALRFTITSNAFVATEYVPMYRYYDAIKLYAILRARNRNEENVSQDMKLYQPVIDLIQRRAHTVVSDDDMSLSPQNVSEDHI